MIRKTVDIRRVLQRRRRMWKNEEFDLLLQEAVRCDKSLRNSRKGGTDKGHIVRVFTRLMLSGKVGAAVRWLSENGRGRVLQASDLVEITDVQGNVLKLSVCEVLHRKHLDPQVPTKSTHSQM